VQLAPRIRRLVERMGHQAGLQLRLAVEAFAEQDTARGLALDDMDDVMDDLQRELFRTIFALGESDESGLQQSVQIALVGRYYERVADHAVNIGQRVAYMVTGEIPGMEAGGGPSGRAGSEVSLD
jgi:phosphate transport system protein